MIFPRDSCGKLNLKIPSSIVKVQHEFLYKEKSEWVSIFFFLLFFDHVENDEMRGEQDHWTGG